MIEVVEFFVRTSKGTIHRAMKDDEGEVYAWKRCRLSVAKYDPVGEDVMSDTDSDSFCKVCIPSNSYGVNN